MTAVLPPSAKEDHSSRGVGSSQRNACHVLHGTCRVDLSSVPRGESSPSKSACAKELQMFNTSGPCSKERERGGAESNAAIFFQYIPYVSSISQD